jgi:hypothetical protein
VVQPKGVTPYVGQISMEFNRFSPMKTSPAASALNLEEAKQQVQSLRAVCTKKA